MIRFADFVLDPVSGELRHGENTVRLQPQPLKLLLALLQRPGELVTREELKQELMPDAAYGDFDHAINLAVSKLRAALNDCPDSPELIETLPRRGYRFVGKVEAEDSESLGPALVKGRPHPWLRRRAAWIGVSLVVLVAGAAIYFYIRHTRQQRGIALTEKDTIVLADFTNQTGDPVFTDTLRQALAVQLSQSPFLNILSDTHMRQTMQQMGRQPQDPVVDEVARELCVRNNSKVYVAGSIASVGREYVVGLKALNCATGEAAFQEQAEVQRKEDVLRTLGKQATVLRYALGESLKSIKQFDVPIEQGTTPSLEALEAYSAGRAAMYQKGDNAAIPPFMRAVKIDPNFAIAYTALAVSYGNVSQDELSRVYAEKALALRDRANERERLRITANYYDHATVELEKGHEIAEVWLRTYPRDTLAIFTLGAQEMWLGRYTDAIEYELKGLALDANNAYAMSNLEESYLALDRYAEAEAVIDKQLRQFPQQVYPHRDLYLLGFLRGDIGTMERQTAWADGNPDAVQMLDAAAGETAAYYGRVHEFRQHFDKVIRAASSMEQQEPAAAWQAWKALWEAELGFVGVARSDARQALARSYTKAVKRIAVVALARAGNDGRALLLADELDNGYPEGSYLRLYLVATARAAVELNQGNPGRALTLLQAAETLEFSGYTTMSNATLHPTYVRGEAFLALHRGSEAAAEFQKFLDHKGMVANCPLAALARLGLARALAQQGQTIKARATYEEFLTLWKDADPDVPIYKQAKAEYAKLGAH